MICGAHRVALAAVLVGSTLLSLVAAEAAFRLYDIGLAAFSYEKTRGTVRLAFSGAVRRAEHPEVRFELKPGLDQSFKLARLQTNSIGLNDREYSRAKGERTFRVAVIGDSQSMASGVHRDANYHALLENRLDPTAFGFDTIEFVNFAVGGYTPADYRDVLEYKALGWSPDLVLIGLTPENDEIFNWNPERTRPFREKPVQNGFYRSFLLDRIRGVFDPSIQRAAANARGAVSPKDLARLESLFSDMKHRTDTASIPLVVVYLARGETRNREAIARLLRELEIEFIDTGPAFRNIPIEETRIYRNDRHPNELAHETIADVIEPALAPFLSRAGSARREP